MSSSRPIITCHVLDTVRGKPAANISVTLESEQLSNVVGKENLTLHGKTNSDGRVTEWNAFDERGLAFTAHEILDDFLEGLSKHENADDRIATWTLILKTKNYWGQGEDTFWDDIVIQFKTNPTSPGSSDMRRHWHVPLLMSPWSYTTYRGS